MVKLKYAPGVTPLRNEHCGCTFQNSRIGQTAMNGQKNDRERQSRQMNKKANLMQAVTNWRNLPPDSKTNWNNFATNYPQPCKDPDSGFLTGYQLFIKRHQYLFLNEGIQSEFLEAPFSEVLTLDNYTFTVDQTENCLDVTENFIKNFGLIPAPGQFLLIKVLAYAVKSGQFFPVVTQTIEILESYIDGLFISLHLPVNCRDTVFSVYLSKPVNQSVAYSGTKTRYMGCFTTKTFLGLTDTPDSYVGQAGKKVKVKADETGLEFVPDTGGGLTCETLVACPTIISINSQLSQNSAAIVNLGLSSLPPIRYGRLYNNFAMTDPRLIAPVGFHSPSITELNTLITNLGGGSVAGGNAKETGYTFFQSPNTGATNAFKFNARGSGYLVNTSPYFFQINQFCDIWSVTPRSGVPSQAQMIFIRYNTADAQVDVAQLKQNGFSARFIKNDSNFVSSVAGNDGKVYRCVQVGSQIWTADQSAETKFQNGELIPTVANVSAWFAASSALQCAYYFNELNVLM